MGKKLPDLQVLISYRDLVGLLDASEKLDELLAANFRLTAQQSALRSQFTELMEAFGELKAFIKD